MFADVEVGHTFALLHHCADELMAAHKVWGAFQVAAIKMEI